MGVAEERPEAVLYRCWDSTLGGPLWFGAAAVCRLLRLPRPQGLILYEADGDRQAIGTVVVDRRTWVRLATRGPATVVSVVGGGQSRVKVTIPKVAVRQIHLRDRLATDLGSGVGTTAWEHHGGVQLTGTLRPSPRVLRRAGPAG